MDERYDFLDELENFLGATFHQDIQSPEHALDEFIEEISKEGLLFTVKYCEEFLNLHFIMSSFSSLVRSLFRNSSQYFTVNSKPSLLISSINSSKACSGDWIS